MDVLIGMDEAGYGPNLGPLVVAATAWGVEEAGNRERGVGNRAKEDLGFRISECGITSPTIARQSAIREKFTCRGGQSAIDDTPNLYRLLRHAVTRTPSDRKVAIADSKVLYRPGLGLRQLERGVHSALHCLQQTAARWLEIVSHCAADPNNHHRRLPWHDGFNCGLPVDAAADELPSLAKKFTNTCEAVGARPIAIRARYVFPAEFNELTEHYGSKGAALSHVTVGLLRELVNGIRDTASAFPLPPFPFAGPSPPQVPSPQSPISVVCDKHGGRNYYAALLQHHFSEHWIEPMHESGRESCYEWGPAESRVRVAFRVGGEAFLPTALASMTAKYLRELAMRAFNEFWCARVTNLRPTAGYPIDARRFRRAIAATQRELGIDDHILWRNR